MAAIAYVALGVLAAILLAVLSRADASARFSSLSNAHRYALQQDAAGYRCVVSPRSDGTWEVHCYRRRGHIR